MTLKKISYLLAAAPLVLAMAMFLSSPVRYAGCVREGISLWAVSVLPVTFPFLLLTALLSRTKLYRACSRAVAPFANGVFRVSGAGGCAALLSLLSGYPVGAKCVAELYKQGAVKQEEVFRLSCLCSTSGPMFLVGTVGAVMFGSPACGWILMLSHLLGAHLICILLRIGKPPLPRTAPPSLYGDKGNALFDGLYSSVISILCAGGAIAVFFAFGQMMSDLLAFLPLEKTGLGIMRGLLEMTAGCSFLAQAPSPLSLALCAFLVTFGGACVLVQQLAFLSDTGVRALPFLGVKLLQGVLAALLCFGLASLFSLPSL